MKITKTRLIVIIIPGVIIIGFSSYLINQFDFTPSTKENPYGVEARVMVQSTYFSPPIQPNGPTEPHDVLWFRYNSKEAIDLRGYTICNGIFCIKSEYSSYSPPSPELFGFPEEWAGGTLGDLNWKVGDTVHIWVKVSPVGFSEERGLVHVSDPVLYIDLGESKIIRGFIERI